MSNNLINIVPYLLPFDGCQSDTESDHSNLKIKCLSYKGFLDILVMINDYEYMLKSNIIIIS
jgi:hypothetical protein